MDGSRGVPQQHQGGNCGAHTLRLAEYLLANKKEFDWKEEDMGTIREKMAVEMTEIPYVYRPSNWFHVRILVHQRFTELNRMRDSLDKVGELKCFQDGIFRQFLELPCLRIFGGRLCQLLLCKKVNHPGGNKDEMWFWMGQTDIRFGKLEFCSVTGLQFGTIPTGVIRGYEDVEGGVLDRCFDGKVPTFHTILNRLDEGNFDKSNDAIKLSYLFLLGYVLLRIEYGKTVPRWACMFVDNLTTFECFP
ncbi:hypothetical protein LWI28_024884 [Acer negundo]|uniref:Ubiquitin-like protease family profile domain-containing protein n=1 Tax=Acer negundo TaxID=4023 RepID=A0AAD5NJR7_ACENE|nr:hypothetical protein LWI28_024884 [Acer negundo]